jgi:hypothetical protein
MLGRNPVAAPFNVVVPIYFAVSGNCGEGEACVDFPHIDAGESLRASTLLRLRPGG